MGTRYVQQTIYNESEVQMKKIDYFGTGSDAGERSFLSNFYPSPIVIHDLIYPTVEHAYQAAKTTDLTEREAIRTAPTPHRAKKLGRDAHMTSDWEERKLLVMRRCLALKFAPDTELAQKLLDTGDIFLEEGNSWGDKIWGTYKGEGQNWLGWLLMSQRAYLRALQS